MIARPLRYCVAVATILASWAAAPLHAADCETILKLRSYGPDRLRAIRGEPIDFPDSFKSTFNLDGTECSIDGSVDDAIIRYTCRWYISKGQAGREQAETSYREFLQRLRSCIANEKPEVEQSADGRGEETRFDDVNENTAVLNYGFWSHWWYVEFEYEYYYPDN